MRNSGLVQPLIQVSKTEISGHGEEKGPEGKDPFFFKKKEKKDGSNNSLVLISQLNDDCGMPPQMVQKTGILGNIMEVEEGNGNGGSASGLVDPSWVIRLRPVDPEVNLLDAPGKKVNF